MDPAVSQAMQPYLSERFYNPSATYAAAQAVRAELDTARTRIAHHLGARPAEVIFTAGCTEANNLAIRGVMEQFPDGKVVVGAIEHESVLAPAHLYDCREAPVGHDGVIDIDKLIELVDDNTVLVSVMYANNEVGSVQPLKQLALKLDDIRAARRRTGNKRPLYFHTDAAQAANYLDLHTARLGVDLLSLNGGKIYGPKQTGVLFVAAHVRLQPQIVGGGQERALRAGTENVAGYIGLAQALDLAQAHRHDETARLQKLQKLFFDLLNEQLPSAVLNGSRKTRLPNNVHVTLPGEDNERLIFALDERGIQCAAGSACSASNDEPSHVLRAMDISDQDAQSSLRFTMGQQTTEQMVRGAVAALSQCLQANR